MVKKNKKQLKPIINYDILESLRYNFGIKTLGIEELKELNKRHGVSQLVYVEDSPILRIFMLVKEWSQEYEDDLKKRTLGMIGIEIIKVEDSLLKLAADNDKLTRQVEQLTKDLNWWTNHITLWSLIKKVF
ncbi:MAG: hypothetical protein PHF86_10455 [Candidatus Nanoarchaeia archaeon]|nr:hypothetical protein [Candidatus Nanoarchaeia archaeon]